MTREDGPTALHPPVYPLATTAFTPATLTWFFVASDVFITDSTLARHDYAIARHDRACWQRIVIAESQEAESRLYSRLWHLGPLGERVRRDWNSSREARVTRAHQAHQASQPSWPGTVCADQTRTRAKSTCRVRELGTWNKSWRCSWTARITDRSDWPPTPHLNQNASTCPSSAWGDLTGLELLWANSCLGLEFLWPNSYPRLEFLWPNSCLGQCHPPGDRDASTCPRLLINAEPPSYRVLTK